MACRAEHQEEARTNPQTCLQKLKLTPEPRMTRLHWLPLTEPHANLREKNLNLGSEYFPLPGYLPQMSSSMKPADYPRPNYLQNQPIDLPQYLMTEHSQN